MKKLKLLLVNHYTLAMMFVTASWLYPQQGLAQYKGKTPRSLNTVANFDKDGHQITRFSTVGDAIDAHDGEIALFNGVYYLYGTSYDCGFEWGKKNAPFCGFKSYSSTDMVNWTDRGFLFDAKTQVWQTRCNGNTIGCFRPHVIYNKKTGLYVLWINAYDNVSGYHVFTAQHPTGPFTEVAEPKLAVNASAPAATLNNGDHDTFVDDDGTAYLAYTDWRTKGTIVIEKLSDDYLTGTGEVAKGITKGQTEAPGMFKRNGIYYVVYSDPNCGYCSGTGASYSMAKSPLGPWSEGRKISDNSCGGQPSFVSTIILGSGPVFLFGSDLWNNAAKNEALANYYWAPLSFEADGSIKPMTCDQSFKIASSDNKPSKNIYLKEYRTQYDISKAMQWAQTFKANSSGILSTLHFTTFKIGYPDAALQIAVYKADKTGKPTGRALSTQTLDATLVGWSAKSLTVRPKIKITAGVNYCVVVKSAAVTGSYGFVYQTIDTTSGLAFYSGDGGNTYTADNRKIINFGMLDSNGKRLNR
jgi:hypothetical protein